MSFTARLFVEQDKQVFDSLNIVRPYGISRYPYFWVVDEEKGYYFIDCGGKGHMPRHLGEPPSLFYLHCDGIGHFFEAWHFLRLAGESPVCVDLAVSIAGWPSNTIESREKIKIVLQEALLECFSFINKRMGPDYIKEVVFL